MAEDLSMVDGLRLGNQFDQLLVLASQAKPIHSQDGNTHAVLAASMRKEPSGPFNIMSGGS